MKLLIQLTALTLLVSLPASARRGEDDNHPETEDDAAKFALADADSDGFLSYAEFATTLSDSADAEKIARKFAKADADGDKLVSSDEWMAYKNDGSPDDSDARKFAALDTSGDGRLDFDEFAEPDLRKRPLVRIRDRFLGADTDGDGFLSLEEWSAYKGHRVKPTSGLTQFELADLNDDKSLSMREFFQTYPSTKSKRRKDSIRRTFRRFDKNDDSVLTRKEWNPGGSHR